MSAEMKEAAMTFADPPQNEPVARVRQAAVSAAQAIPPAWPLSSSVAVNPFLGQACEPLEAASARLGRAAGVRLTMPRAWYCEAIAAGRITDQDLQDALAGSSPKDVVLSVTALKDAALRPTPVVKALPTVAELAAGATGTNWCGLIEDRFGAWASGYFDEGQALWASPRGKNAYLSWRAGATHDLTPEIAGLSGFAAFVFDAPETAEGVLVRASQRLGVPAGALEAYFHRLLTALGGWAQYVRRLAWDAETREGAADAMIDLLAVRLLWEEALFNRYGDRFTEGWLDALEAYAAPISPTMDEVVDSLLQASAERAAERRLSSLLAAAAPAAREGRPRAQAAFCIDVRSEVFRRALESVTPEVQTLGFAGFFGLAARHRRFASDVDEMRMPVLVGPIASTCAHGLGVGRDEAGARVRARAARAWGRFKAAAVSSFAFVEASGPLYAGKLVVDALGLKAKGEQTDPAPHFEASFEMPARIATAETILRAMSLTHEFAPLVLLIGHGAKVTNNPHASALACGACGGHPGDVNARLAASLFNDTHVRAGLADRGIVIPDDVLFLAGLHDTTTDKVALFCDDRRAEGRTEEIAWILEQLKDAGVLARSERARRLPGARGGNALLKRGRDWSQVRPEWGLAGCQAFIAAPRERTRDKNLQGRVFLHDYVWSRDPEFLILEMIMTAPVVVASWISLQYFGSAVAPDAFGAGSKLLHNVVGGIGVLEGNGGILRTGLPWQSIHDGDGYIHEPLRLCVCIEAPRDAIVGVLRKRAEVRRLFDNRWMSLIALDDQGRMAWRYAGDLNWTPVEALAAQSAALHLQPA